MVMVRANRIMGAAVVALAVLALWAAPAQAQDDSLIGEVVPDTTLESVDGWKVKLGDLRNDENGQGGKFVVLTWWSYKCPTGARMMEANKQLAEFCDKNDVVFVGVASYGESAKEVAKYAEQNDIAYKITHDGKQKFADVLDVQVVSTTAILDKDGKVVYYGNLMRHNRRTGETNHNALDALKEVLAGKPVTHPTTQTYG